MQDLEKIYDKYAKIVYKYVFCLTRGDKDITEEIVQETFLVAVRDIKKFRGDCKISTWLCQISKYIWYRRNKRERLKKETSLDLLEESLFTEESIEEIVCNKEDIISLLKKIHKLDDDTRNVMYLRILGNFEYSEIAEIMNKTSNWARVVFFRGKQKLREEFENQK